MKTFKSEDGFSLRFLLSSSFFWKHLLFVGTILSIILWFKLALSNISPQDPVPEIQIITVEKQKEFGVFAAKVSVGLLIKNFQTFDIIRNLFVSDMVIWFSFDPDLVMLETISQFSFDNGDIIKKSNPDIKVSSDKITVKYEIRVSFRSWLTYKRFPLEDHKISFVLTNNFVTPAELFFTIEDSAFKCDPNIFIADWTINDLRTDVGYQELSLESKNSINTTVISPKVQFILSLEKKGIKDALVIFIPLFLVSLISTYSFLTNLFSNLRYYMASSSIPALLGYRFVLQNLLPQIGYFTLTDYIYLMLLCQNFLVFLFQAIILYNSSLLSKSESKDDKILFYRQILEKLNTLFFILVNIVLSFGTYYFTRQGL